MKRFLVAVAFFLACSLVLADEGTEKLKAASKKCNSTPATTVDSEAMRNWSKNGGEKPPNAAAHALCVSKELKWQDAKGKIDVESLKANLLGNVPADKVDHLINTCAVEKASPEETAEKMLACMVEKHRKHQNDN